MDTEIFKNEDGSVRVLELEDGPLLLFHCNETVSQEDVARLESKFLEAYKGIPGKIVILPSSMEFIGPLPGRYAVVEQYDEAKRTVTFQTKNELDEYLKPILSQEG